MELKIGLQKYFYLSPLLREGVLSMYDRELFEREGWRELSKRRERRGREGETREERRETREERREIVQICLLFIMLFKLSFSF